MLNHLKAQPADKILQLMQAFRVDPREDKIDLGVGVYKDADGHTPIMRAIKAAEQQLWNVEDTKVYTSLAGDPAFHEVMIELLLADSAPRDRIAACATPGGTGAVRQAFDLVKLANPNARVFVSNPTWPNHLSILEHIGLEIVPYRYFEPESGAVDFDGMIADLGQARPGDVVLLHGCCHNPTGANLTLPDWQAVVDILNSTGAVPIIDIAYQGFGDGLEDDAVGTRLVASACPQVMIAASCSKNFGIYRERTGITLVICETAEQRNVAQANLAHLNRQGYSFPPDHGARLVTMVLGDAALRTDWQAELDDVRRNMLSLRKQLSGELQRLTNSNRFGFLAQHRGMFSRLGLSTTMIDSLREKNGIYMVGDSRINIAGLNVNTVPVVARAIAETLE